MMGVSARTAVLDQRVDVRQILGTSDGLFVSDELVATEVEDRLAAEVPCNAVLPRFCVGLCRFDKDVEVVGEARPPVKRQGMAADDDGANAPGVQAPKQFFEVARWLVH